MYKILKSHNENFLSLRPVPHTLILEKKKIKKKSLLYESTSKIMTSPVASCDSELYTAQQRPRIYR